MVELAQHDDREALVVELGQPRLAHVARDGRQPRRLGRRAEITCDRAALLCTRDLDVSIACLVKLALGSRKLYSDINVDEYLAQLEEAGRSIGRFDELTQTHPYLPKRVAALRLFAETAYFKGVVTKDGDAKGTTKDDCDAKVAELLAVVR